MRRSHHGLTGSALSTDKTSGVKHLRHHIAKDGFYMGNEIVPPKVKKEKEQESQT